MISASSPLSVQDIPGRGSVYKSEGSVRKELNNTKEKEMRIGTQRVIC